MMFLKSVRMAAVSPLISANRAMFVFILASSNKSMSQSSGVPINIFFFVIVGKKKMCMYSYFVVYNIGMDRKQDRQRATSLEIRRVTHVGEYRITDDYQAGKSRGISAQQLYFVANAGFLVRFVANAQFRHGHDDKHDGHKHSHTRNVVRCIPKCPPTVLYAENGDCRARNRGAEIGGDPICAVVHVVCVSIDLLGGEHYGFDVVKVATKAQFVSDHKGQHVTMNA
jgi:hypothetical protein